MSEDLESRLNALETRLSQLEMNQGGNGDGGGAGATPHVSPITGEVVEWPKLRAFDVFCDGGDNDPWKVYFPAGCFTYKGFMPAQVLPAPKNNIIDTGVVSHDGAIYANVTYSLDENGKITGVDSIQFGASATTVENPEEKGVYSFRVADISDDTVSQVVTGSLFVGGNGGAEPDKTITVNEETVTGENGEPVKISATDNVNIEIPEATPIDKKISINGKALEVEGEGGAKQEILVAANADIDIPLPEGCVESISGRESVTMVDNPILTDQETLTGEVVIAPRTNSGLVVQSFKREENEKTVNIVGIDLVGHHDDQDDENHQLGLKTLTLDKGTPENGNVPATARVFADQDIDLSDKLLKADKSFKVNDVEVAKIAATKNIEFAQKALVAGPGIKIEPQEDGTILVSRDEDYDTGEGFTGSIEAIIGVDYDDGGAYLTRQKATLRFVNGRLVSQTPKANEVYHAATEES